jgi:carbamate kinase
MGSKVAAACQFVRATGKRSAIGQLSELSQILEGRAGTLISMDAADIQYLG